MNLIGKIDSFPELGNTIVIDGIEYVKKREPLSDEDVFRLYEESEYLGFLAYRKGFKDAEKAHGIGVDDESI